jgi:putative alpha-1,2-mannosidase
MASRDAAVMLRFNPLAAGEHIVVRMGMSFISPDQACSNAAEEIPTFDFDSVSRYSISQFESLLNRIRVDTTDVPEDTVSLFYSSVLPPSPFTTANSVIPHIHIPTKLHG